VIFTLTKFFLLCFFVISSSLCDVVLFVVLYGAIWFPALLRCSFDSYWKIGSRQLQIQSMIWTSTLQIRRHGYFGDFNFIILFVVGILPLYAINLDAVSLFADSSFMFLANVEYVIVFDVIYQFEWMNIILFLSKKIKKILIPMKII
jgi:hypothetical protein